MYDLPDFLKKRVDERLYRRWLHRKANAHVKRDRRRGNKSASVAEYKAAIHAAVLNGGKNDAYTREKLRWELISSYNNQKAAAGGRDYKQRFADLPTVDHIGDGKGVPRFVICSWRTNDAKSDLTYENFVSLCKAVLSHKKRRVRAEKGG